MKKALIDRICIRAKDFQGNWGSFTLREVCDMGQPSLAFGWVMERLCGLKEAGKITTEQVEMLVKLLPKSSCVSLK